MNSSSEKEYSTGSDVAVIIATLNEQKGIGPTIKELQQFLPDTNLLVVDGRSTDKTVEIASKLGVEVLLQEGDGKGCALDQGIKHLNPNVKYVIFIDADFTYPARYIPEMIRILERNPDVGMVIGNRFNEKFAFRKVINDVFYFGNRCLAFVQYLVNGIRLSDPLSGLRIVRRKILESWRIKSNDFDVEAEMNYCVERAGYRSVEIPIDYRERLGEKKLKLRHGFSIFSRILSESLS